MSLREPCRYYNKQAKKSKVATTSHQEWQLAWSAHLFPYLQEIHDVGLDLLGAKDAHVKRGGLESVALGRVADKPAKEEEDANVVANRLLRHLIGVGSSSTLLGGTRRTVDTALAEPLRLRVGANHTREGLGTLLLAAPKPKSCPPSRSTPARTRALAQQAEPESTRSSNRSRERH
jgi:hypothetical protein